MRPEGVVGSGLLLCACFPVGPGGWCVLEDGAIRARGLTAVWVLQARLRGLEFPRGQRGCPVCKLVPAVLTACGEEMAFPS